MIPCVIFESKFDRETLAVLLGIDKKEIPEILQRCNYSESFIKPQMTFKSWTLSAAVMKNKILKRNNKYKIVCY
jgi:hypothetical protein